jgi:hypothetical protein
MIISMSEDLGLAEILEMVENLAVVESIRSEGSNDWHFFRDQNADRQMFVERRNFNATRARIILLVC